MWDRAMSVSANNRPRTGGYVLYLAALAKFVKIMSEKRFRKHVLMNELEALNVGQTAAMIIAARFLGDFLPY